MNVTVRQNGLLDVVEQFHIYNISQNENSKNILNMVLDRLCGLMISPADNGYVIFDSVNFKKRVHVNKNIIQEYITLKSNLIVKSADAKETKNGKGKF